MGTLLAYEPTSGGETWADAPMYSPHFEADRDPLFFPEFMEGKTLTMAPWFVCSLNPEVHRSLMNEVDHYFMLSPH